MAKQSQMEEELKQIVSELTIELMASGGTYPEGTSEVIALEYPDLYNALGEDCVLAACETVQYSVLPEASAHLQKMFAVFNSRYFADQLPEYEVLVVYDPSFWVGDYEGYPTSGSIDFNNRRIFLAMEQAPEHMLIALIHHMAHAKTGTNDDFDENWLSEMKRLRAVGAPQWDTQLG
jgi:hypothetical protein